MAKCSICGEKIEKTFLGKPLGTIIKHEGKEHHVCSACQSKHTDLHAALEQ